MHQTANMLQYYKNKLQQSEYSISTLFKRHLLKTPGKLNINVLYNYLLLVNADVSYIITFSKSVA